MIFPEIGIKMEMDELERITIKRWGSPVRLSVGFSFTGWLMAPTLA